MTMTAAPRYTRYTRYTRLPNPPKTPDMQRGKHTANILETLMARYLDSPSVLVGGMGYLCARLDDLKPYLVPHCVVAFGVIGDEIIAANGYSINEVGKPPDFVLDALTKFGSKRDYAMRRRACQELRVGEIWSYDASGEGVHNHPLRGERLVDDGTYEPIESRHERDGSVRGYSAALGLHLVWRKGAVLRFSESARGGEFLRNLSESEKRGDAEHAARIAAERLAASERAARIESERRASSERAARIAAEAELERLRRLLADSE